MAIVTGHLMGRMRGLRHRQRLQHIIRPLQVEQAENFNGVMPTVTTSLILYMECTLASVQGSAIVTGLGVCSPGYASARGIQLGNTSHHFHLQPALSGFVRAEEVTAQDLGALEHTRRLHF